MSQRPWASNFRSAYRAADAKLERVSWYWRGLVMAYVVFPAISVAVGVLVFGEPVFRGLFLGVIGGTAYFAAFAALHTLVPNRPPSQEGARGTARAQAGAETGRMRPPLRGPLLYRFWPGEDGEPAMAFGPKGWAVAAVALGIIAAFVALVVLPLVGYLGYEAYAAPITLIGLLAAGCGPLLVVLFGGRDLAGYYEVDREGNPLRFVSPHPPERVKGRGSVRRKRYLLESRRNGLR